MANTSISGLAGGAAVAAGDLFPDVQTVGVGPVKVTAAQLKTFMSTTPTITAPVVINEAVGSSALTLTGATQTSSFPVLSATQTWNNAGTTFTAWKLNVTNTASAAGSLLLDLQIGGSSQFNVSKTGVAAFGGTTNSQAGFALAGANVAGNVVGVAARLADNSGYASIFGTRIVANAISGIFDGAGNWGPILTIATNPNGLALRSTDVFGFSNSASSSVAGYDASFSRISAGVIGVGTGAQGSVAGGLQAATLALGGATIGGNAVAITGLVSLTNSAGVFYGSGSRTVFNIGGTGGVAIDNNGAGSLNVSRGFQFGFATNTSSSPDAIITSPAAATLQLGAADASSAVAQTLQVQSSTGASTTGPDFKIIGSGGTTAGGSILFQVKATTTAATALSISSAGVVNVTGAGTAGAPSLSVGNATTGLYSSSTTIIGLSVNGTSRMDYANTLAGTWYANASMAWGQGGNSYAFLSAASGNLTLNKDATFGFVSSGTSSTGTQDTVLSRKAAGIFKVSTSGTTGGVINFDPVTVANLPSASTAGKGARAFVTDALAPAVLSTVVGGGATAAPVFSDGTNWIVG